MSPALDVGGFALLAAVLIAIPGQDTVLVLRNAIAGDARAGVVTTAGICCGLFFHATLSALGVSALLVASAEAFAVLRWAGAAYLVWLGLQSLRRFRRGPPPGGAPGRAQASARGSFAQGLLSNVLNPKTAVFYLALLPQFAVRPETVLADSLLLAALHAAMSFAWLGGLAIVAERAGALLRTPRTARAIDGLAGLALVGFGVRLALGRS